jgi:hypothetical protein
LIRLWTFKVGNVSYYWLYALVNSMIIIEKVKMLNLGLRFIMDGRNGMLNFTKKSAEA